MLSGMVLHLKLKGLRPLIWLTSFKLKNGRKVQKCVALLGSIIFEKATEACSQRRWLRVARMQS